MKILVFSDTHGETDRAEDVIRNSNGIDLVIHLGDYFRDAQKLSNMFPQIPFEYVYGNSDFMIGSVAAEKILEYCGKRILITHGHRYSVNWDYSKLYKKAEDTKVDMILFGHTHIAHIEDRGSCILLNPGSISDPRDDSRESYAIITLDENSIQPVICTYKRFMVKTAAK
ncbi:YfcE family phosphodiesterase [Clostridium thermosuccinogenes]|jgi:putative phosphoesterase|uniref:Phosphoesterase n=1 Tax=Clostridium thermosuccinogenes TaxID=84032 RepID=A0A2K2FN45_9CLOT|nr:metallophosphoesterase [Pseudoclostridium thermosuccinogenes]AUS97911.1 YfcE family phosphodiesterase [Pseudoclostridium thermosuccinogenes]PNT94200.1 YfcE family phosphodiesterase [Pseudoclostridium thermosuccinogenes]PNU00208.1 YfcE family phosphodiesterase [Pseudoclostridium thermosuccinogenes]PNU01532.1 YfcE family phosphodiesterase [Pseudoclostridium thermosuccinogenes]